jgi:hypothetical protein
VFTGTLLPVLEGEKPYQLTLAVRWDVASQVADLGILTLFLKHYPTLPIRLRSPYPGGPEYFNSLDSLDFYTRRAHPLPNSSDREVFTVFEHSGDDKSIVMRSTPEEFTPRFLGRPFVAAILDSGKMLSAKDEIQALFVEIANNIGKADEAYVERLSGLSKNARFLGNTHDTCVSYFYLDNPEKKGGPILFMAYDYMLRMYESSPASLPMDQIWTNIEKHEQTIFSILVTHGASYTPSDLRFVSVEGKTATPTIVDYLIERIPSKDSPVRIESIKRWIDNKNVLPNWFSLGMLIFRYSSSLSPLIHQIVEKAPHLLRELAEAPRFILNLFTGFQEGYSLFISLCKKHQVTTFSEGQFLMKVLDERIFYLKSIFGIEFVSPIDIKNKVTCFKETGMKVDPTSEKVQEGFLKVVRAVVNEHKTAELAQKFAILLLKTLEAEGLVDSPTALVAAALTYAENSRFYTTLCIFLRNLLRDLGGAPAPAATPVTAAVSPTTLFQ